MPEEAAENRDGVVSHNVFFTLKDASEQAIASLIADCHTYLKPLPGIMYFSTGRILEEHQREVNVRDFHVGLHVTFLNRSAHDYYHESDAHARFVERNEKNWAQSRVFDFFADYQGLSIDLS